MYAIGKEHDLNKLNQIFRNNKANLIELKDKFLKVSLMITLTGFNKINLTFFLELPKN